MYIKNIKIINFRGLTIDIDNLKRSSLIFGENDSGKTTLCKAVMRVLDLNERRKRLEEFDSTNCNKEEIVIEMSIVTDGLNEEQTSDLGRYLDQGILYIKLVSKFNDEINYYEDELIYGDESKDPFMIDPYRQTPLDKVLSVIYIEPNYKLDSEKKTYFNFHDIKKIEEEKTFSELVDNKIQELETQISIEDIIKEMSDEINTFAKNEDIFFDDMSFKISPNISINNLLKSLDILPVNVDGKEIENIGDGKSKILSMILHQKSYDVSKVKIIIAEEPENHLYPSLQANYLALLKRMNYSQLIVTSHSPKIINLNKLDQIIRLRRIREGVEKNVFVFDDNYFSEFGELMTLEMSEMLFYENVLLVEGSSEKYFYDFLFLKDKKFQKKVVESKLGIFSINGIAFKKTKNMLSQLGINVFIKTDNDIFGVKGSPGKRRYSGLLRAMSYVSEERKEKMLEIFNFENDKLENFTYNEEDKCIEKIEEKMSIVCDVLYEDNIILSSHSGGFEKDFQEYLSDQISEEDIEYLKKCKLQNLHNKIVEGNIDITINEKNENSPLVRFLNEL